MPETTYIVERSRNKGKFWARLLNTETHDLELAREFLKGEHKDHPSDWLRIVEHKASVVSEIRGNDGLV